MTIIDLHSMKEAAAPSASVLCLGNFDGVHLGHLALIQAVKETKETMTQQNKDVSSGICFFRCSPHTFISSSSPSLLTTYEQKLSLFAEAGLDYAFVVDFEEIGEFSPKEFIEKILKDQFHCVFVICGFNFRFGKGALGNPTILKDLMNGQAEVVPPVIAEDQVVSSTSIRALIENGEVNKIPNLLGRPFSIEAVVLHGKALGRTIGVPTINQTFPENIAVPKHGIYISAATIDGKRYAAVSNIGIRPSINDGSHINCETHILNFNGDLYGKLVKVEFYMRLRGEIKFDTIDALKAQIQQDILKTQEFYKEAYFL